jgi:hypothetical protein
MQLLALTLAAPFVLGSAGCSGGGKASSITPSTKLRSPAQMTICSGGTDSCGSGGGTVGGSGGTQYYQNIYAVPVTAPMSVKIQNAMRLANASSIDLIYYQPDGYSDAQVQAVNHDTGVVLGQTTLSAAEGAGFFGCKSVASCVAQWVRDWIIEKGMDWLYDHRGDLACLTTIPAYGSCPQDITEWVPAWQPPPGTYWVPTTFDHNPGYGWVPYIPTTNPMDPNDPNGYPARQQCSTDSANPCGPPADSGTGQPVQPKL